MFFRKCHTLAILPRFGPHTPTFDRHSNSAPVILVSMPNRGKILLTWSGEKKFRYDGSVSTGITIQCGTGFSRHYSLNTSRLRQVVTLFAGREVRIGTHRTAPPEDSIGLWFQWPRVQIPPPTPQSMGYGLLSGLYSDRSGFCSYRLGF